MNTMQRAAEEGALEKVQALLDGDPDLVFNKDERGWTPLHQVAWRGHKDVAELLLAKGAEVNTRTDGGLTPLHLAASEGHKDVAELLLASGAEVDAKDNSGFRPLHTTLLAIGSGPRGPRQPRVPTAADKDVAELLLAKGAEVNARADRGLTPLHLAAGEGHKYMAELLLASGAEVNARADGGITPLYLAAEQGHKDTVELLRASGAGAAIASGGHVGSPAAPPAHVDAKDNSDFRPLHTAAERGHSKSTIEKELSTWKSAQEGRLNSVRLPCVHCRQALEVKFDPPAKCPNCNRPLFKASNIGGRAFAIGFAVLAVGMVILVGYWLLSGPALGMLFVSLPRWAFYLIALAVVFPLLGGILRSGVSSASVGFGASSARSAWIRYHNRLSSAAQTGTLPALSRTQVCWLFSRTLLAPFQVRSEFRPQFQGHSAYDKYISGLDEADLEDRRNARLLTDLLWADTILELLYAQYPPVSDQHWGAIQLKRYSIDSEELLDAARLIGNCSAQPQLLQLIAKHCSSVAPKLSETLLVARLVAL